MATPLATTLPPLRLGDLVIPLPIVQGGMGVRIGMAGLCAAVAREGGLGTLSAMGLCPVDTKAKDFKAVGNQALLDEIAKFRALAPGKALALNVMVAATNWADLVQTAAQAGVELIVSGAGLPLKMPSLVAGTPTKIAPIVSSGRAAAVLAKAWAKQGHPPDAVVLEGPLAGGHLGYTLEELAQPRPLVDLLAEVKAALAPFEAEAGRPIPVIAAGGIFDGADVARLLQAGAAAVQLGTRFVATHECDAHPNFKEAFLACREEDVVLVTSPVGMPLRAIRNGWLQDVIEGKRKQFKCHYKCLHTCNAAKVQYCIADALYQADVEGHLYEGFVICGSTTPRLRQLQSVRELLEELLRGAEVGFSLGLQEPTLAP